MEFKGSSIEDLAIYISDHLKKNSIDTVLSGGACVSIYTKNKYHSYDLDFVLLSFGDRIKRKKVMGQIGFYEKGRYFKHKNTPYIVEFLAPPLSVGEEPVKEIAEIKRGDIGLKLLSPTDCVKDRLAAFFHWNDKQSLDQAILVCEAQSVDLKEVERWAKNEEMENKFKLFLMELYKN